MHVKLSGKQVVDCTVTLSATGPWSVVASVNTQDQASGRMELSISDSLVFSGTVKRAGVVNSRSQVWMTGGAGRLQETIQGKAYADVPVRVVLADILGAVGELLSTQSDVAVLDKRFKHWIRARNPARRELEVLLEEAGAVWRQYPDGSIWVGVDDWPETQLKTDYVILEEDRANGRVVIAADCPSILPGEMFLGGKATGVEHRLAGTSLRTTVSVQW